MKPIVTILGYVHAHRFIWAAKDDIENIKRGTWLITRSPNGSIMERTTVNDSMNHCMYLNEEHPHLMHSIESRWLDIGGLSAETVQGFSDELMEEIHQALSEQQYQP
jgi:hypothetical protein